MNLKSITTALLAIFVVASLVVLIARNSSDRAETSSQDQNTFAGNTKVVVYYFHRTQRCPTCLKIEELTAHTMHSRFESALQSGELKWKIINVETAGNEHFETDYDLVSQSVVLARLSEGNQIAWKNLDKIWELVGDESEFQNYIGAEVQTMLDAM